MFSMKVDDEIELALLEDHHAQLDYDLIDRNRDYLGEWMSWIPSTTSVDSALWFARESRNKFAHNNGFDSAIWYRGEMVGSIGLVGVDSSNRKTEIGYWVSEDYQGKGIVTRACRAVIDYAFDVLKVNRLELRAATGNTKSRAVAERLGFTQEGVLRQSDRFVDHYKDMVMYSLLADEWAALKNQ